MTVAELLAGLTHEGIHLTTNGDHLLWDAPQGALTPELRAAIAEHKAEMLALLSKRGDLPEPSRWSRLADSGLHHNDVADHGEVTFLFALELIADPSQAKEDCQTLPSMWAHYFPFWRERLPREAFAELEQRYRRRLAALGLQEEVRPPQGPRPLRPLALNPEGTGCLDCGSQEYWVSTKGARYCLTCHPVFFKDAIAIGTIRSEAEGKSSRPSNRKRVNHRASTGRPLATYARPVWQRPNGSCFACGSRRAWRSIHGVTICAVCHPPASPDLVAEWIEGETK